MSTATLEIEKLNAISRRDGKPILRDVSISLEHGHIRGLVGESGAGKSTIAKAVLGMLSAGVAVVSGSVRLNGVDLLALDTKARRRLVAAQVALIPQDPLTALNPGRRIGAQLIDGVRLSKGLDRRTAEAKGVELLAQVGLREPERLMGSYPHQLSGGMRQRVLIAAAFSIEPSLLIADEPTTALDVTVQRQVLQLFKRLQARHGTAALYVTHDLGVAAQLCDEMTVLFQGMIMEQGATQQIFAAPRHVYTEALIAASPRYDRPLTQLRPMDDGTISACWAQVAAFDTARQIASTP